MEEDLLRSLLHPVCLDAGLSDNFYGLAGHL